jgi:predicted CXXCH cytochrome family protein
MPDYLSLISIVLLLVGSVRQTGNSQFQPGNCISCHGDLIKNTVVHSDLESSCEICHTSTGLPHPDNSKRGFLLSDKVPVLCFNCHSDFQERMEKLPVVHGALKAEISCINCHNPHSSSNSHLLINGTNDLCLDCHDKTIRNDTINITNIKQELARAKTLHPPLESDGCIVCHNPHFTEKNSLLVANFPAEQYVASSTDNFELCFTCHDSQLLTAATTKTATNFRNATRNLHAVHINGEKGRNCTVCHSVHGAVNDRLISGKVSFGSWEMDIDFKTTENGGTCLTACHTEKKYDRTLPKPVAPKKSSSSKK